MKIIKPSFEILTEVDGMKILRLIEKAGRICHKSEDKITEDSCIEFVRGILKKGHESVIEHSSISVLFICNRGFTHEMVRHRLAAFSQESTRYCNYSIDKFGREITVIKPSFLDEENSSFKTWETAMSFAESSYFILMGKLTPQEARGVLPIDVKTEIMVTTNLREWRHILKLRTSKAAHPSMRELMIPLLNEFKKLIPVVFDDIEV